MLTIADVARFLKLKPQTIYRWVQVGKIPGAKLGKEWRFRRSAIEKWVDKYLKDHESRPLERDGGQEGDEAGRKRPGKKRGGPDKN